MQTNPGGSFCYFCGKAGRADAPCATCMVAMPAVFCGGCGARSSPLDAQCGGCGQRVHQAVLPSLPCPACSVAKRASGPLVPFTRTSDALTLHGCNTCRGVFVPARAWCMLLASPTTAPELPTAVVPGAVMQLVGCPLCKKPLERGRFAGKSDVVVDLCDRHGIWLDAGELTLILAFVVEGAKPVAANVDAAQAQLEVQMQRGDAHLRAARLDLASAPVKKEGGLGFGAIVVISILALSAFSAVGFGAYRKFFAHHGDDVKNAAEAAEKTLAH